MLMMMMMMSVVSRAPRLLTLGMRGMLFANVISVALFAIQITYENMSTTIDSETTPLLAAKVGHCQP